MGSNMDKIYIVMNYVEHDLKSLMETMKQPFLPGTTVDSKEGAGSLSPEVQCSHAALCHVTGALRAEAGAVSL